MNISSAADFHSKRRDEQLAQNAEPLPLPSGLTVLARRPSPDWWIRHVGRLPESLAVRIFGGTANAPPPTATDVLEYSRYTVAILDEVIMEPRVRLKPGPDEIAPTDITDRDFKFILAYARGEIAADGQGLDRFPGRTTGADAGADGQTVGTEAE